ncbi:serine hydrolase domain-containing protein [Roseimaritima ulvae]|uniref:serine hydrolase domain-containing protein n=1 Tax=Roseimaritima ulvae TaxID=980254 RepID=UPI00143CC82F|nr:serine hydrolase domain-containing protein [Roseimaritima ulvae]
MTKTLHDRTSLPPTIGGSVAAGFEPVRTAFERNFVECGEQGAACTLFHRGRKVVDLWGGYRDTRSGQPWTPQTLTLTFSVTKGMAAAAMAVAHSRGLFELDEPVARYWPEFAAAGKSAITVGQLLSHQAGLIAPRQRLNASILANHDQLAAILAEQAPHWEPGTRHGYHTLTLGWYQNELIRRTDPAGRSLGVFFQQEIAEPLGIEFYIGLPADIDPARLSHIAGFPRIAMLAHLHQLPAKMVLSGAWPTSLVAKSIRVLPVDNPSQIGAPPYRHLEIPSANGFGTAAAIARVYDSLVRDGEELGLSEQTSQALVAPPVAPTRGSYDAILKVDSQYHFGFSRPSGGFPFGSASTAFGCPGAGGSFAFADPQAEIAFAYVTNKMSFRIFDDPRERAVRKACYACLSDPRPVTRVA